MKRGKDEVNGQGGRGVPRPHTGPDREKCIVLDEACGFSSVSNMGAVHCMLQTDWGRFNVPQNTLQVMSGRRFYGSNDPTNSVSFRRHKSSVKFKVKLTNCCTKNVMKNTKPWLKIMWEANRHGKNQSVMSQLWRRTKRKVCNKWDQSPRRGHCQPSGAISRQNFSRDVSTRTLFEISVLCFTPIAYYSIVKCSCSPRTLWHFNHTRL